MVSVVYFYCLLFLLIVNFRFLEVNNLAIEFLKIVNRDFAEEFAKSVSALGPEVTASVQKLFS